MSNKFIKRANSETEFTPEQVVELNKCRQSAKYFVKNYIVIRHPVKGAIPFALYDYQEEILDAYQAERNVIIMSARQTGKSETSAAFLLWYATFHFDKTVLIASNKNANAMEMISRILFMYEHLPFWLKAGASPDSWNKHEIAFDNGSRIISVATTANSGRGMSISKLFCDEFAFVRPSIAKEFWTSISPTLATGGDCIISSTPNGDQDIFSELWRGAESQVNDFKSIYVAWDRPPNRDEVFKRREIGKIGETRWRQEYECLGEDTILTACSPDGQDFNCKLSELLVYSAHI